MSLLIASYCGPRPCAWAASLILSSKRRPDILYSRPGLRPRNWYLSAHSTACPHFLIDVTKQRSACSFTKCLVWMDPIAEVDTYPRPMSYLALGNPRRTADHRLFSLQIEHGALLGSMKN